jgi:hypothetical protein
MKRLVIQLRWLMAVATVMGCAGCGSKATSAKMAAEQLQQSYEKTDAPIKQEVAQASAALQSGNYAQAVITMNRVTQAQAVDEAQKKAVGILIQQTRQAVQQNPKLNSPELYKAMSDLVTRVHGEN